MKMQSRRTVLGHLVAGGVGAMVAGSTTAAGIDLVFVLEAHRTAAAAHLAALAEQIDDSAHDTEAPCHAEMAAFKKLIDTAPQTLAGLGAWAAYLNDIETWMFEDEGPTLVAAFAEAAANLAAPRFLYCGGCPLLGRT